MQEAERGGVPLPKTGEEFFAAPDNFRPFAVYLTGESVEGGEETMMTHCIKLGNHAGE